MDNSVPSGAAAALPG